MPDEGYLKNINSPDDLKKLNFAQMDELAAEIRTKMVKGVSKSGGHLAPSLGVVELTLALHYVFDSPKDAIVWDVGHQCYVHKMLTGRADSFDTIRQYKGISGFPKRHESEHDIVDTGHSSTSVSFAVGLAEAKKHQGDDGKAIAVIGDGAIASGMAYEALNHAGHLRSNVLVILNDNEMSISPSVGAFANYLGRVRLDPRYRRAEEEFEDDVKSIPRIGGKVYELGKHIKSSIKQMVVPSMIFEELGFTYVGPIDGHNIELVAKNLRLAKELKHPVLLHVITKNGKGYEPAEKSPDTFHGTSPFDIATGLAVKKDAPPAYTKVFGDTLAEIAAGDDKVAAITAAMKTGTGLDRFAEEFPGRFYDVGIAEQHAVAFASALAMGGMKPVAAIYSTFMQRAYDQVIHDICLQEQPVVLALDRAGIVGEDGPTHHGVFDLSYLMPVPGITIMAPKDENELRHMLKTAFELRGPVAIRYPRRDGLGVDISEPLKTLDIGKSERIKTGSDVAIIAIGTMVDAAEKAAEALELKGHSVTVINARFAKPIDENAVAEAAINHGLVVTMEENALSGGFGEHVAAILEARNIKTGLLSLGLPDGFIEHGPIKTLLDDLGLSPAKAAAAIAKRLDAQHGKPGENGTGAILKTIRKAIKSGINGRNDKDTARHSAGR
jgi:1-deoxy-D-xylulose-5-phosphate synthase